MLEDVNDETAPDWDGERYMPGMPAQIELEHRHRYILAARLVAGKHVLDCASGEGYGSAILAATAAHVTGVDIDATAITNAQGKYRGPNLAYLCASCTAIPLPDASFDVIVSFETIEHHEQHEAMMSEFARLLKHDGLLIISSPNRLEYSDVPGYVNPHHVKELYFSEFAALLARYFPNTRFYGQRVLGVSVLMPSATGLDHRIADHIYEDADSYTISNALLAPLYFVALAGRVKLPDIGTSIYQNLSAPATFAEQVTDRVETKVYVREGDEQFSEQNSKIQYSLGDGKRRRLNFSFATEGAIGVGGIRVDFCDQPAWISIDRIEIRCAGFQVFDTAQISRFGAALGGLIEVPEDQGLPNKYLAYSKENWLELGLPQELLRALRGDWQLGLSFSVTLIEVEGDLTPSFVQQLSELLMHRRVNVDIRHKLYDVRHKLDDVRQKLYDVRRRVADLSRRETDLLNHLRIVTGSLSWRVTKPLRVVKRLIRPDGVGRREQLALILTRVIGRLPLSEAARGRVVRRAGAPPRPNLSGQEMTGAATPAVAAIEWKPRREEEVEEDDASASVDATVTAELISRDFISTVPRPPSALAVRALAFYLPQFHPIPENDAWWGKGFTEWTNVTKARPQFEGHYQPHLPGELGFYDLRIPEVMSRQVDLAKAAGLEGFCFHFYWFGGKRLLEDPLRQFLQRTDLDLSFCLCWANENWSRRWNGRDSSILIQQQHSAEDDIAFISYIAQYLRDPRYIHVAGKPLIVVYRPELLPEPMATAHRWRIWARTNGIGEIHLASTHSFERADPVKYGFDAAIEFPPNNSGVREFTGTLTLSNPRFQGKVLDYGDLVERSRANASPAYRLYRTACPSWDNEPRRAGRGTSLIGASPRLYQQWLESLAVDTIDQSNEASSRLLFINAWNEWAEGAHLEPDRRFGYAWIKATRDALVNATKGRRDRLVIVVHDAHPHGAQFLALNIVAVLSHQFHLEIAVLLLKDGILKPKFEALCPVYDLSSDQLKSDDARRQLVQLLYRNGFRKVLFNTIVGATLLPIFNDAGFASVTLIHEMESVIRQHRLEPQTKLVADLSDILVFPAPLVRESFEKFAAIADTTRIRFRPQGLYKKNPWRSDTAKARAMLRERLGLPAHARIVLGAGFADLRKGIDLFVGVGETVCRKLDGVYFVWVGHWQVAAEQQMSARVKAGQFSDRFLFPGRVDDTEIFFAGCDIFALTSREDPFPSVVLEAMESAVPVVAFYGASGLEALLSRCQQRFARSEDVTDFSDQVISLLDADLERDRIGAEGRRAILKDFSFRQYMFDLLDFLGVGFDRVSVVVPNFNYARFIQDRIRSIVEQSYPIYELIVLDDRSTDDSVARIALSLSACPIDSTLIENDVNSGSVFAQWRKGVELAQGNLVWIAEADDLAEPDMLRTVQESFSDPDVVLSYCQSKQIDESGKIIGADYRDYVADISVTKWTSDYVLDGVEEIRTALAVKNTIPNVSAVVFRRQALLESMRNEEHRLRGLTVAGDWLVYLEVLARGKIAFSDLALNLHRRHTRSVTLASFNERQLKEIRSMQMLVSRRWGIAEEIQHLPRIYAERLCQQFEVSPEVLNQSEDVVAAGLV